VRSEESLNTKRIWRLIQIDLMFFCFDMDMASYSFERNSNVKMVVNSLV
jgi:hypothetical protein